MKKSLATALFALFSALISIVFLPNHALAHAGVTSTFPVQDQILDVMPLDIQVTFSEELLTLEGQSVNTLSLATLDGTPIEVSEPSIKRNVISVTIPAGTYEAGTYEVTYKVVSTDGHKVSDSFSFAINASATTSATDQQDQPVQGDGVMPVPILIAVAILVILGGFFALRSRQGKS